MKYLYALAVVIVIAGGIALSMYISKQPQSVAKVPYAAFSSPEEFMSSLGEKLKKPLQDSRLVFLGVTPGRRQDLEFWKLFLETNKDSETAFQAIVVDPKLPNVSEVFPEAVKIDLKNELARFAEGAVNAEKQNIRMAVIAPTIYISQVLEQNSVSALKANHGLKPTSFSLTTFPRATAEEANMEEACKIGDQDRDGTGTLGCVIQNRARPLYRVPLQPTKFEGFVDQLGERDFLIYWNPPRQQN